jgi:hypothetical protein
MGVKQAHTIHAILASVMVKGISFTKPALLVVIISWKKYMMAIKSQKTRLYFQIDFRVFCMSADLSIWEIDGN